MTHQVENERLLLLAIFTANFLLVLRQANTLWQSFDSKTNRRSIGSCTKRYKDFQNNSPFERSACFYVKIVGDFGCSQYFNFETSSLKIKNLFQNIRLALFQLLIHQLLLAIFTGNFALAFFLNIFIKQIENGQLLLLPIFLTNFVLVFILAQDTVLSQRLHFKTNIKGIGSSTKKYERYS